MDCSVLRDRSIKRGTRSVGPTLRDYDSLITVEEIFDMKPCFFLFCLSTHRLKMAKLNGLRHRFDSHRHLHLICSVGLQSSISGFEVGCDSDYSKRSKSVNKNLKLNQKLGAITPMPLDYMKSIEYVFYLFLLPPKQNSATSKDIMVNYPPSIRSTSASRLTTSLQPESSRSSRVKK
ncbi:hypothetical protein YC2023_030621 [Brassica napus]